MAGFEALTCLPQTWLSTVVVPRTTCRGDSVVCCRSAVHLRPSCHERGVETIMPYVRRASNVEHRRFCCLPSLYHTAPAVVPRTLCRDVLALCRHPGYRYGCRDRRFWQHGGGGVSVVVCWHRLAASILAAYIGYVFGQFLTFHTLLLNYRRA